MLKRLRVGGVPEHFNYPWHLAKSEGAFKEKGIDLQWVDFPGGTGAMAQALRNGEIDMATILTEGMIADILRGNPSKILQFYVKSSLKWGVHVAPNSKFERIEDLKGTRSAISRYGSGSHLMNYILADNQGWSDKILRFEEIKDLDGAIDALTNDKADYFLWERFTTKPIVDRGIFRWIGNCPTPWPCFVVAATNKIIEEEQTLVEEALAIINGYTRNIKSKEGVEQAIANKYGQKEEDINKWIGATEWESKANDGDQDVINHVAKYLLKVGAIETINPLILETMLKPLVIG